MTFPPVVPNGFLALTDCNVYHAVGDDGDCCESEDSRISWFDVDLPFSRIVDSADQNSRDPDFRGDGCDGFSPCSCCFLVLEKQKKTSREPMEQQLPNMTLKSTVTGEKHQQYTGNDQKNQQSTHTQEFPPRYDGTVHDISCSLCGEGLSSQSKHSKRSDASLLLGLALASQDYGHIVVQSIKVGIYSRKSQTSETEHRANYQHRTHYRKRKARLLIAFACQELFGHHAKQKHRTSLSPKHLQTNRRRFFVDSKTTKSLPAATQLVLSIMSSDWREYDKLLLDDGLLNSTSLVRRRKERTRALSFFPSRMNLEDVFVRIGGVSSSPSSARWSAPAVSPRRSNDRQTEGATAKQLLLSMPSDVLCHHIGGYLRARSLAALRGTCLHLHWTLRAVVPGLRLDLYSHQIESLQWMRERESKPITEDDLLMEHRPPAKSIQTAQQQLYSDDNTPQKPVSSNEEQIQTKKQKQPLGGLTASQWSASNRRTKWDGDAHRAATGGGTVVLCPRLQQLHDHDCAGDGGAIRISQSDCCEVVHGGQGQTRLGGDPLSRKVARGGLLCDDPGLGKTITVISLILQTMGLTTEKETGPNDCKPKIDSAQQQDTQTISIDDQSASVDESDTKTSPGTTALSPSDERIFEEYWNEQIIPEFRGRALTKLFSTFLRSSSEVNLFFDHYWRKALQQVDTKNTLPRPLSLKEIRRRIGRSVYDADSLQAFVSDVESCFEAAIVSSSEASVSTETSSTIREAALRLLTVFRSRIVAFKTSQVEVATKSFSRASSRPDSIVAALVQKTNSEKLKNALLPSSATLLVVPAVLVDHWMEQFKLNVDISYCTGKIPLVFNYTGSNSSALKIEEILLKCRDKKTHFPFIFVDRTSTKKIPPPSFIALFKIVITTNNRFSSEWKNGSFEDEMRRNHSKSTRNSGTSRFADFRDELATSEEACPLLKVNWLRMIVDEGHSMGRSRDNSSISFASWINAERRWAMTGTPTPQTSTQSGLTNVFNLMQYLQHEFFTRRHDGDTVWNQLIVRSWNRGFLSSFFRLRSLLSLLMIRHVKSDITELPLPIFKINTLSMGFEEVSTYNTLVCAIQSNLVITSMKGKTSGAQDSLLHKSQTKHAREAISNLRLVCAGGTQVRPTLSDEYHTEFHQDFENCNSDPIQRTKIREFISRATTGRQSKCDCCSVMLSTLLVFPCGHLVCTECVDSDTTSCIVCDKEFDVDAFQRLQPGFKYDWLHNVEEEAKERANCRIEPTAQDEGGALPLPGGHGVLIPSNQRQRRARTRKFGDGHTCQYDPKRSDGKCVLCFAEHEPCYLVGERRCSVCYRSAENCPTSESKITHIIEKLLNLYHRKVEAERSAAHSGRNRVWGEKFPLTGGRRPPKVIVFSQFRKVLNITGDRLLRRFGSGCIAEYWGKYRKKELQKFVRDEKCLCMLLGKDGSEGLDLSFVTHIVFLEQVWDKSLENQVVARAWRMGARGSVEVETLVAENSIEETMFLLEGNQDHDPDGDSSRATGVLKFRSTAKDQKNSEYQQAKVHYLLNSLKLIADNTTVVGIGGGSNDDDSHKETTGSPGPDTGKKRQLSDTGGPQKGEQTKRHRVSFQV